MSDVKRHAQEIFTASMAAFHAGAGGWVSYKADDEMNSDEDEVLILAAQLLL